MAEKLTVDYATSAAAKYIATVQLPTAVAQQLLTAPASSLPISVTFADDAGGNLLHIGKDTFTFTCQPESHRELFEQSSGSSTLHVPNLTALV